MKLSNNPVLRSGILALVVFVFTVGADLLLGRKGISRVDLMVSGDALAAAAFGAVYLGIALRAAERRRELEGQLRVIAEMNHHIRNALQAIVYAQTLENTQYSNIVRDSVKRIEWALSEILPGEGRKSADVEINSEPAKINKIHAPE